MPLLPRLGTGYRFHVTGLIHGEDRFPASEPAVVELTIRRLTDKVTGALDSFYAPERLQLDDADIAVVAYGCIARSAQKAVQLARAEGIKVGLYRPITIWPFHYDAVGWALDPVRSILAPELNQGQLTGEVERPAPPQARPVRQPPGPGGHPAAHRRGAGRATGQRRARERPPRHGEAIGRALAAGIALVTEPGAPF